MIAAESDRLTPSGHVPSGGRGQGALGGLGHLSPKSRWAKWDESTAQCKSLSYMSHFLS